MAKKPVKKSMRQPGPAKRSRPRLPKSLTAKQILAAVESTWEKVQERRRGREFTMQGVAYQLPDEVRTFLGHLFEEPPLVVQAGWTAQDVAAITRALWQAYEQGCEQGYIEGRLVEITARREVGAEKQRKTRANLVPFDGVKIPMDVRDARIFFELPAMRLRAGTADEGDELMGQRAELSGKHVRNIYFEQTVLREHAALVQQGFREAAAAERVVQKYGIDKHGKPRHKKVRDILAKAPQRRLPEVQ